MPPPSGPAKPGHPSPSFKLLAGVGFAVVCLGLFAPRLVPSQPTSTVVPESSAPTPVNLGGSLLKMAFGLGVVAVAVVGVTRYLKRRPGVAPDPTFAPLASLPLDSRCVVHLVRVADRLMLVGTDHTGVKAVTELPATDAVIGPVRIDAPFSLQGPGERVGGATDGRPERPV